MRSEAKEWPRESKSHSLALPLARMHPGHACSEHTAITLDGTFVSLTPVAGSLTFSVLANITRRDRAHQQRVRFRALDRRDPSTISRGQWWRWTQALFSRSRSTFFGLDSRLSAPKRPRRGVGGIGVRWTDPVVVQMYIL